MKFALPLLFTCLLLSASVVSAQNFADKHEDREGISLSNGTVENGHTLTPNKWDYFLYPVPAVDEINIKVTRGHVIIQQVNIVDESGDVVLELKNLSGEKVKVDIAHLQPGRYFLQVRPDKDSPLKMKRFYVVN